MFSELIQLGVFFAIIIFILIPVCINVSKNSMYDEWKKIWKNEVEAEKRKIAMQSISQNKNKLVKKTK